MALRFRRGELDMLTTKASLLAEEFGQVGGDWRPTRMVRRLRTRFTVAALKEGDDGDVADAQKEIQAIGELILSLGGRQSASAIRSGVPPLTFLQERRALRLPPPAFSPPLVAGSAARRPARRRSLCWRRPTLAPQWTWRPSLAPLRRSRPLRPLLAQRLCPCPFGSA